MARDAKAVTKNMQQKFSRNVGETEQDILRHLLDAVVFAHCTNWLVKLTPGANVIKLFTVVIYESS